MAFCLGRTRSGKDGNMKGTNVYFVDFEPWRIEVKSKDKIVVYKAVLKKLKKGVLPRVCSIEVDDRPTLRKDTAQWE